MSHAFENSPLPDYTNPPVVETILGVQFERLPNFTNGHLGAFWKSLNAADWPVAADAPPLQLQFERFSEAARWAKGLQIQLSQIPAGRLQIKSRHGDRMIQVQNGRLHFNWLGESGGRYPRYEAVRAGFTEALESFIAFATQSEVGRIQANQWEITYVNHIPKGTIWNVPADWTFFLPLQGMPSIQGVIEGENFAGEWHFVIPGQRGRLHIEWQHAPKGAAKQPDEIIQITLTARGPIESPGDSLNPVLAGLDLGRATIVRAFRTMMNDDANRQWGLIHANA